MSALNNIFNNIAHPSFCLILTVWNSERLSPKRWKSQDQRTQIQWFVPHLPMAPKLFTQRGNVLKGLMESHSKAYLTRRCWLISGDKQGKRRSGFAHTRELVTDLSQMKLGPILEGSPTLALLPALFPLSPTPPAHGESRRFQGNTKLVSQVTEGGWGTIYLQKHTLDSHLALTVLYIFGIDCFSKRVVFQELPLTQNTTGIGLLGVRQYQALLSTPTIRATKTHEWADILGVECEQGAQSPAVGD